MIQAHVKWTRPPTSPRHDLLRAIGRWSLVALVVNSIIGSGVFGLPSTVAALIGNYSPYAVLAAGVGHERDHRLLRRGRIALSAGRRPLPLRPRRLRPPHGHSNRLDALARPSRRARRQRQLIRNLSRRVFSPRQRSPAPRRSFSPCWSAFSLSSTFAACAPEPRSATSSPPPSWYRYSR
jgi:hypothetical protein